MKLGRQKFSPYSTRERTCGRRLIDLLRAPRRRTRPCPGVNAEALDEITVTRDNRGLRGTRGAHAAELAIGLCDHRAGDPCDLVARRRDDDTGIALSNYLGLTDLTLSVGPV